MCAQECDSVTDYINMEHDYDIASLSDDWWLIIGFILALTASILRTVVKRERFTKALIIFAIFAAACLLFSRVFVYLVMH